MDVVRSPLGPRLIVEVVIVKEPIAKPCLIADVGGTNSRIALWSPTAAGRGIVADSNYRNDDYDSFIEVLAAWQREHKTEAARAIVAVAGPVRDGVVTLSNRDWSFSTGEICTALSLESARMYNDFYAQALAVPELAPGEKIRLGLTGASLAGGTIGILGPGTGLGVAGLQPGGGGYHVISGEGGNAGIAAHSEDEAELLGRIRADKGFCSAEHVISGAGLELLDRLLNGENRPAPDIARAARHGESGAQRAIAQMWRFLGSFAGDLALTLGATGGVYITGGVALANRESLLESEFSQRFVDKGRYRSYLENIPTYLIIAEEPALIGLAADASRWAQ